MRKVKKGILSLERGKEILSLEKDKTEIPSHEKGKEGDPVS